MRYSIQFYGVTPEDKRKSENDHAVIQADVVEADNAIEALKKAFDVLKEMDEAFGHYDDLFRNSPHLAVRCVEADTLDISHTPWPTL